MKSKVRNQRMSSTKVRKQQHLLEVTVRADKARIMRNRAVAAFICKTVFVLGLLIGSYLGGKELLRRFVWENPDYALTDIRVSSDGALQRDQILHAGNIVSDVNIFTVKTAAIRAGIDALPQVERAEVQRILPNRLDITITERRPIAWLTSRADEDPTASESAWLVDARGVVMKSKRMLEEYYHLPQISGVPVGDFVPGQRINLVEIQAALELVRLDGDNTRWQARNIDLAKGYCLVVTDQNHTKITFGLDDIDQQMERLFRYLDRAEAEKKEIQTINLIVKKNTPVTFHDPNALEGDGDTQTTPPPVASGPEKTKARETPAAAKPPVPVARAVAVSTPLPSSGKTPTTKGKSVSRSTPRPKPDATPLRKPFRP